MANIFEGDLDNLFLTSFGGAECSHCKQKKIVRDTDYLCIDCWEALGSPASPRKDAP